MVGLVDLAKLMTLSMQYFWRILLPSIVRVRNKPEAFYLSPDQPCLRVRVVVSRAPHD